MYNIILPALVFIAGTSALGLSQNGIPRLDGRIIGGETVEIEQYPYQVSLQQFGNHVCGATLISDRHVLTAAHCTDGLNEADLQIRLGSSYHASGGIVIKVRTTHQHEDYDGDNMNNDISVLELAESVTFSSAMQPASLADANPADGEDVFVSGWGRTTNGNPSQLQATSIRIVNHAECAQSYESINDVTDVMFCAAAPMRDACQGDSGGPLVGNGRLVGVISWGYGCAHPVYPGVYTSVALMRDFINQHSQIMKNEHMQLM